MKAKALKTIMVSGRVYLEGQEIPTIEEDQLERLLEIGAVEEVVIKAKRKRRTKRINQVRKEVNPPQVNLVEDIVPEPLGDTTVLETTDLPM